MCWPFSRNRAAHKRCRLWTRVMGRAQLQEPLVHLHAWACEHKVSPCPVVRAWELRGRRAKSTRHAPLLPPLPSSQFSRPFACPRGRRFRHGLGKVKVTEKLSKTSCAACWRAPRQGRVAVACLRDLRRHGPAPQGSVGPALQLCSYETRVVNS
jgi:hypothetical protein